jgi:hypothetical protein
MDFRSGIISFPSPSLVRGKSELAARSAASLTVVHRICDDQIAKTARALAEEDEGGEEEKSDARTG